MSGLNVEQVNLRYQFRISASNTPVIKQAEPQKVQITRTADGKLTVKGLLPGQQLVQYPDGKLQVISGGVVQQQQQQQQQTVPKTPVTPTVAKQIIKPAVSTPVGKVVVQGNQVKLPVQQSPKTPQQVFIKQQVTPKVQNQVVVSGNQVIQQQVVVSGNQVLGTPVGQQQVGKKLLFSFYCFFFHSSITFNVSLFYFD